MIGPTVGFMNGFVYGGHLESVFDLDKKLTTGVGFEVVKRKTEGNVVFPIFASFKYYFRGEKNIPYLSFSPGYCFARGSRVIDGETFGYDGGFYAAAMVGFYGNSPKAKPYVQVGYKYLPLSFSLDGNTTKYDSNFICLDFGVKF